MVNIHDLECLLTDESISSKASKERILKDHVNHNCVCFDTYLIKNVINNVEDVTVYMNWRPRLSNCGDYIEHDNLYVPYDFLDLDRMIVVKEALSDTAELRIPTFSIFDITVILVPRIGLHYEDIEHDVIALKNHIITLVKRELNKMKSNEMNDFDRKQTELTKSLLQTRELLSELKDVTKERKGDK